MGETIVIVEVRGNRELERKPSSEFKALIETGGLLAINTACFPFTLIVKAGRNICKKRLEILSEKDFFKIVSDSGVDPHQEIREQLALAEARQADVAAADDDDAAEGPDGNVTADTA